MRTDILGRRLRFSRQAKDTSLRLKERDLEIFAAIHRHGPLPSNYLYEFTRETNKSEVHLKHRLTKLFHGLTDGTHFLDRPPQQYQSFLAKSQRGIYELAGPAKALLAEHNRLSPYIGVRKDHFLHQFMAACVSASIELACKKGGLGFITKHEIFSHEKCPESTKDASNPMALPVAVKGMKHLVPDDLFAIRYRDGKHRFFAVEIDRNTESIDRKNLDQNTFGKKLHGYLQILERRTFEEVWGIPALMVLTITTNATHAANMASYLSRITQQQMEKFLFKSTPEFGVNWIVPPVLYGFLSEPWKRANGDTFDISRV